MPVQNRVTPLGDIIATPHRGIFTGNRGIIHDPRTKTLTRRWASRAWLTCVCEFRGRRRQVMGGRSWTELFFLDEATALAAGHRPCFFCRRDDANRFRAETMADLLGVRSDPVKPQDHNQRRQALIGAVRVLDLSGHVGLLSMETPVLRARVVIGRHG